MKINSTCFRQQTLAAIRDMTAGKNKSGRYDLIYDEELSAATAEYKTSTTEDMLTVAKAVRILGQASLKRKQTFTARQPAFFFNHLLSSGFCRSSNVGLHADVS